MAKANFAYFVSRCFSDQMSMFLFVKGVCYIRTSRQDSAIIYNSNEDFHVGEAKVSERIIRKQRNFSAKLTFTVKTVT